jgi:hypothetical protein
MLWSCGKAAASVQASGDSCGKAAASFQASGNSCGKAAASLQPLGDSRGDVDMLRVAAKALVAKYKHSEAQNPARKQPACLGNAGDESCEAKRPVSLAEANARRPISLAEANAKRPMSLAEANSAIDGKTEAEAISSAREVVTWQRATFRNLDDKNVEVKARLAPAAVNTSSTGQTIASTLELAAVFNRQRQLPSLLMMMIPIMRATFHASWAQTKRAPRLRWMQIPVTRDNTSASSKPYVAACVLARRRQMMEGKLTGIQAVTHFWNLE